LKDQVVDPSVPESAAVGAGESNRSLAEQVSLLRREVAELRQQIARLPGGAHAVAEVANPRTDPVARAAAEQEERLRAASAEASFQREAQNPRWSESTAREVRATLAAANATLGDQIHSVECRSQSCRVVLGPDGDDEAQEELPATLGRLASVLPRVTATRVDQGDGRVGTVLYLTR
jgi:hypothetical protein